MEMSRCCRARRLPSSRGKEPTLWEIRAKVHQFIKCHFFAGVSISGRVSKKSCVLIISMEGLKIVLEQCGPSPSRFLAQALLEYEACHTCEVVVLQVELDHAEAFIDADPAPLR